MRVRQAIFKQQLYQCMLSQTLILKSDIETRSQILQQYIWGDFCRMSWMCVGRTTQRKNPRLLGLGPWFQRIPVSGEVDLQQKIRSFHRSDKFKVSKQRRVCHQGDLKTSLALWSGSSMRFGPRVAGVSWWQKFGPAVHMLISTLHSSCSCIIAAIALLMITLYRLYRCTCLSLQPRISGASWFPLRFCLNIEFCGTFAVDTTVF